MSDKALSGVWLPGEVPLCPSLIVDIAISSFNNKTEYLGDGVSAGSFREEQKNDAVGDERRCIVDLGTAREANRESVAWAQGGWTVVSWQGLQRAVFCLEGPCATGQRGDVPAFSGVPRYLLVKVPTRYLLGPTLPVTSA